MESFVHQIHLHNHKQVKIQIQSSDNTPIISSHGAQRAVNVELVRKMGQLITTGEPQLLIDEAKGTISWQIPFLVQAPRDDKTTYPTGELALVDACSGTYVLEEDAIKKIKKTAHSIINRLYPDMQAYLKELHELASTQ